MASYQKSEIKISVRNIIEFIMRSGDLESGFIGSNRAVEGTYAHQKVQKSRQKEEYVYQTEVHFSHSAEYDKFILSISGRADGIIHKGDRIIIDEIKSTGKSLESIDENYNPLHWGQVMLYAYFYILEKKMDKIEVQLTYFQLESEQTKEFVRKYSRQELEEFFDEIVARYLYWADYKYTWNKQRNSAIEELDFPFDSYRKGQRQLAVSVYKSILDNKKLYAQAPTGIGKTISTIFPSIKAMGEKGFEKIFYLTARTVTRQVAEEGLQLLYSNNLRLKSITLTAKEKICFQDKTECHPELCPYARGHYDRVNDALKAIVDREDLITRDIVEKYAEEYKVCPFEFSLDLTLWADMVICDYNYLFDPRVGLKRFFSDDGGDYIFLVDEAHNLIDRAREMYSADLYLDEFIYLKKVLKEKKGLLNTGYKEEVFYKFLAYLDKLITLMSSYQQKLSKENDYIQKEEPLEYQSILNGFINKAEELLILNQKVIDPGNKFDSNISFNDKFNNKKNHNNNNYNNNDDDKNDSNNTSNNQESAKNNNNGVQSNKENVKLNLNDIIEELLNQYFHVVSFMRIMEIYNENFIVYYQQMEDEYHNISRIISNENSSKVSSGKSDGKSSDNAPGRDSGSGVLPSNFMVKLFCLDPQQQLQEVLKKGKAAVFFSATLTPLTYHREILGGNEDDYILDLESPFDSNNLCLMIAPTISTKYSNRKKSYSVIADLVAATISSKKGNYLVFFPSYAYMTAVYDYFVTNHPDFDTIIQSRDMTERERGTFLRKFSANKAITGFAVLGGIFSEGVDLKGDRLLGSIVVGVAHPRICLERNLIRDYFQKKNGAGYEFAYLYPGINKVLQAAGRTIRTETDRGLILLIGERFTTARYQVMLPGWWNEIKIIVPTVSEIKNQLEQFWI